MTTHLSVNNYYGINDCNTIYMGFWKNENLVFFLNYLYYLFSLFFIFQHIQIFGGQIFLEMLEILSLKIIVDPHLIGFS